MNKESESRSGTEKQSDMLERAKRLLLVSG
jgi:hypothetical protein